jgi:hypothetical protein
MKIHIKTIIGILIILGIMTLGFFVSSCSKKSEAEKHGIHTGEREILHWTCGMHPSVKSDESGKCPICNMDLVPVYREHDETGHAEKDKIMHWTCGMHPSVKSDKPGQCPICHMDLIPVKRTDNQQKGDKTVSLKISSHARSLAGIKTDRVAFRSLHHMIRTVGKIHYDERRVARVSAWISGRIDKLFIDFTGMEIEEGEPLALIYSPDLISTQEEYILALANLDNVKQTNDPVMIRNSESLVKSTRQRLLLWGISETEIRKLEMERTVQQYMKISSPNTGTVVEKSVLEGQYVKEGQNLYTVVDLSHLWLHADVYEYEMGWIKEGQHLEISSAAYPGETFNGKVVFIDPVLHAKTRSIKIRADIPNPARRLKPGMFVDVSFHIPVTPDILYGQKYVFNKKGEILSVPASAVIQTGVRNIVYEEIEEGSFTGRKVTIGPRAGNYYPLIIGLSEGASVVVRGNFLIDSQTQLTGMESAVYDAAIGNKESRAVHQH